MCVSDRGLGDGHLCLFFLMYGICFSLTSALADFETKSKLNKEAGGDLTLGLPLSDRLHPP